MRTQLLALVAAAVLCATACSGKSTPAPTPTPQQEVTAVVSASQGAEVSLPNGATVRIPAGSLANDTTVSIERVPAGETTGGDFEAAMSVGERYQIDLGGQTLQKPAVLEVPFDPALLPEGNDPSEVFLAYYDETTKQWLFAGGEVDSSRNVVILPITHASWWEPWTWNWGAWIAVLSKALKGNVVDILEAATLLTDDCPQEGQNVSVNLSQANNVVQGCVERDDPETPELRIVNPKSFFFEVRPVSGGNGYPPQTMLAPGESLRFQANTSDPSPLVVSADITQKAGWYLVVHLMIQMLPGANQLRVQGPQIACITERVADVSYIASASEALLRDHNGTAAAEKLVQMLLDGDAMRRFIQAADDCGYGPAATWSAEGIRQIGAATSTIISATDFVANYFLNTESQVLFNFTPPARCPVPDESFCEFVRKVVDAIARADYLTVLSYMQFYTYECIPREIAGQGGVGSLTDCIGKPAGTTFEVLPSWVLGGEGGWWTPLDVQELTGNRYEVYAVMYPQGPLSIRAHPAIIMCKSGRPVADDCSGLGIEAQGNSWAITEAFSYFYTNEKCPSYGGCVPISQLIPWPGR